MNISADLFKGIDAALLDMDGTLLDSMRYWRECNIEFLEAHGITITPGLRLKIIEAASSSIVADFVRAKFDIAFNIPDFVALQKKRMMEYYLRTPKVKPGVREFLSALRNANIKVVLASATWATHATIALSRTGLLDSFDAICCCDAIGASKAKTEYFNAVSAITGVKKERMIFFDDALYAITGAKSADVNKCIAVLDCADPQYRMELASAADATIEAFSELTQLLPTS